MNELVKHLVETIIAEENNEKNFVVIYSGRFQPFHKGHYAVYESLIKKFGKDRVYIATSNVTDTKKSPFNFAEKKLIMTKMFGVSPDKIVQIRNPYAPAEILSKYDPDTTGAIFVVGEKDDDRLSGKYFLPYNGKVEYGYKDKGYVYASSAGVGDNISGTKVREWLGSGATDDEKKKNFLKVYPKWNEQIFKLITLKLSKFGESVNEEIKIDVNVGDTVLMGKFKNHPVKVKTIGRDDHGMPTINGKKATTFRISNRVNIFDRNVNEEGGLGGGAGVGLSLPGGYINGSPDPDEVEDTRKKLKHTDDERYETVNKSMLTSEEIIDLVDEMVGTFDEMAMPDMKNVEKYADKQLSPEEIELGKQTDHFFQRLNDPRNGKEISPAELIGFFKRLGDNKRDFLDFVKKYQQFVVKDNRTNINIAFMKQANKLIAKTIMRKPDFKTSNPTFVDESVQPLNELAWQEKTLGFVTDYSIPFTPKVAKAIYGDMKVTTFHLSDIASIDTIKQLVGRKKSISSFTYMRPNIVGQMSGIQTYGGVVYELIGKVLIDSANDIMSRPDEKGRRWLTHRDTIGLIDHQSFRKVITANSEFLHLFGKWISNELDGKGISQLIAKYIETAEKWLIDNADAIKNKLALRTLDEYWNEVVLYDIQVHDVLWTDDHEGLSYDDGEIKEMAAKLEKIATGTVYFTRNPKDAIKFVNSRGGMVAASFKGKRYKGAAVGSTNPKVMMSEGIQLLAESNLNMHVPSDIRKLYDVFKKNGKQLYIVGGAVRDAILGKTPKDFDLATDATPDEVLAIAKKEGFHSAEVGKAFGVVIINGNEIATFRKDIGKGRRPESVDYTDIEGDVKRRDLTINALFYDMGTGKIVDLIGGIADLHNKKIRTVGDPIERFDEDALRKLRALRFHSQMGGQWDEATLKALKDNPSLTGVSAERIRDEFVKSLGKAKSTKQYLETTESLKFLSQILPGLSINKPYVDENDYIVLLAYLLKGNSPETIMRTLNKLKYTGDECKDIAFLVSLQQFKPELIARYKKTQSNTKITPEQILTFGKLISKDFKKFAKFNLKLKRADAPEELVGKEIGDFLDNAETKRYLNESVGIQSFRELFNKMPSDLQKRIYDLKKVDQDPTHHPEGNVLKHTITVVNRVLKYAPNDIDLAIAAMFHDIGKDSTAAPHPTKGTPTHYKHEKTSSELVDQYSSWIKSVGGNPDDVQYIVTNHMRMKTFDDMKLAKQRALQSHPSFDKLTKFATKYDKGGLHEAKGNPTITFLIGPPASGKSTWVSAHAKGAKILSRDEIVDSIRKPLGLSYSDTFKDSTLQDKVNHILEVHTRYLLKLGKDIVVDMTNMSKEYRHKILSIVPSQYTKNAVIFNVSRSELQRRLDNREKETGKHVPPEVVDAMIANYEKPDSSEFDNIIHENKELNEVAWEDSAIHFIEQRSYPYTPKVAKALYGDLPVTTFHITDVENVAKIKSLVGKKKSISSFTYMDADMLGDIRGIQTKGGVILQLEAKILLDSAGDAMSQPDRQGRRWTNDPWGMTPEWNRTLHNNTELTQKLNAIRGMNGTDAAKTIAEYIRFAEDFIIKNKEQFIKELTKCELSGWNEVVVYDIKVKDILWTDVNTDPYANRYPHTNEEIERTAKFLKQIATGTVYFTEDPRDAITFVKSRGGMAGDGSWGVHYKGAAVGSTNPATIMERLDLKKWIAEDLNRELIVEGGAYGHMHHPFDTEINLTFGDLKNIVKNALTGELELTREKTDGQALAISWSNGKLVAARNKSHLKNKGKDAMTLGEVASKFAGRGGLTDAYNYAMQDLSTAVGALSDAQRQKVFKDGACFMNLEVIYPTSVNVIPYNNPLLIFHGTFEYDMDGNILGENQEAARVLAGMIKQVNQHVQTKYKIQGPPVTQLPKSEDLSALQPKYLAMISNLQNEFKLSDKDGVADYHQAWWENFVDTNAKGLPKAQKDALVKRWAFLDKSFKLKDIADNDLRSWAEKIDKQDQQKISKDNLMKFEEIFLGVGADVLSFMQSVLTVNPEDAKRQMMTRIGQTIKDVKASGDPKKVEKMKLELKRLQAVGGFDKIVPIEGIVFSYKGNTMKLTGSFAACNQLLGIFFDK